MQELTKKGLTVRQLEDSECIGAGGGQGDGAGAADVDPDCHRFQEQDPAPSIQPKSSRRKVNMCRISQTLKTSRNLGKKSLSIFLMVLSNILSLFLSLICNFSNSNTQVPAGVCLGPVTIYTKKL